MFNVFGSKKTTNHDYGKKEDGFFNKGIKFIAAHSGQVADVAGTVGDIAGVGAGIAAATGVGAPIAAGLTAIAGGSKALAGGARIAGSAARGTLAAEQAVDLARSGDIVGAVKAGKSAGANLMAAKKGIQRK